MMQILQIRMLEIWGSQHLISRGLSDLLVPYPVNASSSLVYDSSFASAPSNVVPHAVRKFQTGVNNLSPSIVVIIIILAVIFFLSGCLHLLIRFIARAPRRDSVYGSDNVNVLQGPLQQLFHLHDSGVDQSFIDTLPVFLYKSVQGLKEATDCAVCLCTFEAEDALRLLPKCSHAFHTECIDTWLLSHSTCPLCRASLLPDSGVRAQSVFVVVPSENSEDDSREHQTSTERHSQQQELDEAYRGYLHQPVSTSSSQEGSVLISSPKTSSEKTVFIESGNNTEMVGKMMPIKLGKFRSTEGQENSNSGIGSSSNADCKRCYSMGSYDYVLDPSNLHVLITPTVYKKQSSTKTLPLTPGHRPNLSECMLPREIERSVQMAPHEDFVCESRLIKVLHSLKPKIHEGGTTSFRPKPALHSKKPEEGDSEMILGGSNSNRTCSSRSRGLNPQSGTMEVLGHSSRRTGRLQSNSGENLGSSRRTGRLQLGFGENLGSSRSSVSFQFPVGGEQISKPRLSSSRLTVSDMGSISIDLEDAEDFDGPHPKTWESGVENLSSNDNCSSASHEGSENSVQSFAKRTINWLVGRQKRIVHASSASANST